VVEFWTPSVSCNQVGVDAETQDFRMEIEPNMLIPTQLSPPTPRSPSVSCSVVEEPISVVSAVISMSPELSSPPVPLFCVKPAGVERFDERFVKIFNISA